MERQDPALVEKFAELWGTHELVCSYGASRCVAQ